MPRIITSPVKRWPGQVTLPDYLNAAQDVAFEDARNEAGKFDNQHEFAHFTNALIPGIMACVEKWELKDFPEHPTLENFPKTPRGSVAELISWLIEEISRLFQEADELPNA